MPKNVKALPYSDIFNNVLDGFDLQLKKFFGNNYNHDMKVVAIANDDALAKIVQRTNKEKIDFPFFGRKYNSIEENPTFNNWLFRFDGITLRDDNNKFWKFQLVAIKINITLNFICNDDKDLRLYMQRWMDCAKLHYLDYYLVLEDNPFRIRVDCDPNFTFPEWQTGQDIGEFYNSESTITIHGYMGSVTELKTINKVTTNVYDIYSTNKETGAILVDSNTYTVKNGVLYNKEGLPVEERIN